ncbi:MAG: hypothetical protein GW778_05525 [Alphaproteobacteria bacterium]|nr:hypothetical protein [Alphaproteobacteria bacterium]
MVDSIGSTLPPSVQAVNKARSNAQTQRSDNAGAARPADEVSLSAEAQELSEVSRLTANVREVLQENLSETLAGDAGSFDKFL